MSVFFRCMLFLLLHLRGYSSTLSVTVLFFPHQVLFYCLRVIPREIFLFYFSKILFFLLLSPPIHLYPFVLPIAVVTICYICHMFVLLLCYPCVVLFLLPILGRILRRSLVKVILMLPFCRSVLVVLLVVMLVLFLCLLCLSVSDCPVHHSQ